MVGDDRGRPAGLELGRRARLGLLAAICAALMPAACAGPMPPGEDASPPRAAAAGDPSDAALSGTSRPRQAALPADDPIAPIEPMTRPRGLLVILGEGAFAPGRAMLGAEAQPRLAGIAAVLRRHPGRTVLIEGHTDDTGDAVSNLHLSLRRAAAVKERLVATGIAASRLLVRGRGERVPIAGNDSDDGRSRNRRVEVVVLDPGGPADAAGSP